MEVAVGLLRQVPATVNDAIIYMACTRSGQHALVVVDRILCIVEAINFFSAPVWQQRDALHESKEMHDYKRPLPWFLLIPMLLYCRVIRTVMSVVAWPFGWQPVTAMSVVVFMQKMRRKVRYIKIKGARIMNDPALKEIDLPWIQRFAIHFIIWGPLRIFVCIARLFVGEKNYTVYPSKPGPRQSQKRNKRAAADGDGDEFNTAELLDKYAEEDDNDPMNDPDFDVKSADLVSESEEDEEEEGELLEENSEPEEDAKVRENGASKEEGGSHNNQENNNHQENHDNNNAQPTEENHHNEQQQHHQHHEEHQHHY